MTTTEKAHGMSSRETKCLAGYKRKDCCRVNPRAALCLPFVREDLNATPHLNLPSNPSSPHSNSSSRDLRKQTTNPRADPGDRENHRAD